MKKFLCFLVLILSFCMQSQASPGDTTWVQANQNDSLSWYGNYDAPVSFPTTNTSYRRIYMIFTLGKYMCPAGSTYCGDWDYTVLNYLMTPGGDTLELARLITPYANASAPRTPWTWQQHYVYDVTDYAYLLRGNATMRILYSGYSGGFTANIKFAFIEGTPDRDVAGIKRLWHGSYAYGDTSHHDSNDINNKFYAIQGTAPAGTQSAFLKFLVTGHGSDANYCNEFCSHNYAVFVDSHYVATQTIWRDNCGMNELYPQSGTWLYERANWCPGALVIPRFNYLPGVVSDTNYNIEVQFDPYVSNGGASYTVEGSIIYYKGLNKTLDASLDGIISPTADENHFRENPVSSDPVIHIKNTGAATINSMQITCTVDGGTPYVYNWSGSLGSLQETDVTIAGMPDIKSIADTSSTSSASLLHNFHAQITQVNGGADDDATNDAMGSSFITAPSWPAQFKILMKTNNESDSTGNSETRWQIIDESNTVVASRNVSALSTLYTDTITLAPGAYRLVITDGSCDGLQWWANSGTGITAGYLNVKKMNNAYVTMNGYSYGGTYANDFGCGFTQYFVVNSSASVVNDISKDQLTIAAYPNPARDIVNIDLGGMQQASGTIRLLDALGRTVLETTVTTVHKELNISGLVNGLYTVEYISGTHTANILTARLLIAR